MEKKTYEIVTKAKLVQKSQATQTTLSIKTLEEKLRQKDRKIHQLEKELQKFKKSIPEFPSSLRKGIEITPSITNISSYPEVSPYFRQRIVFSSNDFDSNHEIFKNLNTKLPLDTANIQEINSITPNYKQFTITPEPPQASSKFKVPRKKNFGKMTSKSSIVRNSKLSLKSKTKLEKKGSIISELLFEEDTDKEAWSNMISKFRDDPKLLSQALKHTKVPEENKLRCSMSTEPPVKQARVSSAYNSRKVSQDAQFYSRPISASIIKSGRTYRPITAKVREVDWSKSALDVDVSKEPGEMFIHENILNSSQVENYLDCQDWENFDQVYEKAVKTLEVLKKELMLPASHMIIPPKSTENLKNLLNNCSQLLQAKALICKVLKMIHLREDSLLKLMASEENKANFEFEQMQKLGQEIVQTIIFLKHTRFPIGNFVYLGEDYVGKIKKDNESILALFPGIKPGEIFEGFSL